MAVIMKRKVRLGDGTILQKDDPVSEARLKKFKTLKDHTKEKTVSKPKA